MPLFCWSLRWCVLEVYHPLPTRTLPEQTCMCAWQEHAWTQVWGWTGWAAFHKEGATDWGGWLCGWRRGRTGVKVGSQTERAEVRAKGGKVAKCSQGVASRSLRPLSTPSCASLVLRSLLWACWKSNWMKMSCVCPQPSLTLTLTSTPLFPPPSQTHVQLSYKEVSTQ